MVAIGIGGGPPPIVVIGEGPPNTNTNTNTNNRLCWFSFGFHSIAVRSAASENHIFLEIEENNENALFLGGPPQ